MDWTSLAQGNEVIAIHTALERSLIAINGRAPRILRIGRVSIGAMLPDDGQLAEVEGRGLRIGNVGLAVLIHQNAARRTDPFWPPQIKHPADHVEHVDAHVADDSVAILHERSPTTRMHQ